MDANENNGSKLDMQSHQMVVDEEAIISFGKALKEAKKLIEKTHSLAVEINDVLKLSNQYVSDSDVEDSVPRSSIPFICRAAINVEEKSMVDGEATIKVEKQPSIDGEDAVNVEEKSSTNSEDVEGSTTNMLKILLPNYFKIK